MMRPVGWFISAMLVSAGMTRPAAADVAPNPGGAVVVTNSTTASASYVSTPVTQQVNDYATTLDALLNGTSVLSVSFDLPFSDPTVQQAVASADAILTGDSVSFATPSLASSTTVLQSSVTTPASPPTLSCDQILRGGYPATGEISTTTTTIYGPATISVGDCQDDTFNVLAGQEDLNVNTDTFYAVPVDIVTTDTYLTTQSYTIVGSTTSSGSAPASMPEPGSSALLLAGLTALVALRRSHRTTQSGSKA